MSHILNIVKYCKTIDCEKTGGVLVQLSLDFPSYTVKQGKLVSQRAIEIEKILELRKKQFGLDVKIMVSKNCIEGKELWELVKTSVNFIEE